MIYDHSVFRAYDIRGLYPSQMNESLAYAAGQAFVQIMGAKKVVVGMDVRPSGPSLADAMIQGIADAGASVIEVGVISTDMLYFASATLECDGGMSITASHNPAGWNGIKFIAKDARPITKEGELGQIYDFIQSGQKVTQFEKGGRESVDLLPRFVDYLNRFKPGNLPALTVAVNPNFGALGKVIDAVCADLPITLAKLNWQEDGTFPKGTPDPMLPSNRKEIAELIAASNADFGVAFDADADRAFFYDETGRPFNGYYITALLAKHFLAKEPGAPIIAERRLVWAVRDAAEQGGGTITYSRTGHGYFKKAMREQAAIFGGELSGHLYYRDFFSCDSGIISMLTVSDIFAQAIASGKKVSQLLSEYEASYPMYPQEMNFHIERAAELLEQAKLRFDDAILTEGDGLSVEYPTWYCNMRMSSNEPVLRVNVEAKTATERDQRQQELLAMVEVFGGSLRNDE